MNIFGGTKTKEAPKVILQPYKILGEGEYPICKLEKTLDTLTPPKIMLSSAFSINREGLDLLKHRERLFKAEGRFNHWFTDKQVKELQGYNFTWFVLSEFITRFNYHASLGRENSINQQNQYWYSSVSYVGDIPSYSLDRIETATKTKLTLFRNIYDQTRWDGIEYMTIHSMQPMPVELRIADPVVIGWRYDPDIWLNQVGSLSSYKEDLMGVVITAWDKEKELR